MEIQEEPAKLSKYINRAILNLKTYINVRSVRKVSEEIAV
jgi:hypothetical protein